MKSLVHPKPFYFIRHGESVWNTLNQFAGGGVDTPLTDLGVSQAQQAVATFETLSPEPTHIIHSTLSRARDTAVILNKNTCLPIAEMHDLREIDAGEWEGRPSKDALDDWANGKSPDNGESLDAFTQRIQSVFNMILSNSDFEVPFIAAHGRIINGLDHLYGIQPRSFQIKNCQILEFQPSQNLQYPWYVYDCSLGGKELLD